MRGYVLCTFYVLCKINVLVMHYACGFHLNLIWGFEVQFDMLLIMCVVILRSLNCIHNLCFVSICMQFFSGADSVVGAQCTSSVGANMFEVMQNSLFDDVKLFFMCLFMYFFYFEEVRVGL